MGTELPIGTMPLLAHPSYKSMLMPYQSVGLLWKIVLASSMAPCVRCRPGQNQRVTYNGHKRVHALKVQSVALPNGIIGNIYGPVGKKVNFAFLTQITLISAVE